MTLHVGVYSIPYSAPDEYERFVLKIDTKDVQPGITWKAGVHNLVKKYKDKPLPAGAEGTEHHFNILLFDFGIYAASREGRELLINFGNIDPANVFKYDSVALTDISSKDIQNIINENFSDFSSGTKILVFRKVIKPDYGNHALFRPPFGIPFFL